LGQVGLGDSHPVTRRVLERDHEEERTRRSRKQKTTMVGCVDHMRQDSLACGLEYGFLRLGLTTSETDDKDYGAG
jgi:hypothetical protein